MFAALIPLLAQAWPAIAGGVASAAAGAGFSSLAGKSKSSATQPVGQEMMPEPDIIAEMMRLIQNKKGGF